jgi:hypothetical protein
MKLILRCKLDFPYKGYKKACLVKPEGIREWIELWRRGWEYHTSPWSSQKFMRKYYEKASNRRV